jgi:hypothetical protein
MPGNPHQRLISIIQQLQADTIVFGDNIFAAPQMIHILNEGYGERDTGIEMFGC